LGGSPVLISARTIGWVHQGDKGFQINCSRMVNLTQEFIVGDEKGPVIISGKGMSTVVSLTDSEA